MRTAFVVTLLSFAMGLPAQNSSDKLSLFQNGTTIGNLNVMTGLSPEELVSISCAEWHPKPKGCQIRNGKTLDDLVQGIMQVTREQQGMRDDLYRQTGYLLGKLDACERRNKRRAALDGERTPKDGER